MILAVDGSVKISRRGLGIDDFVKLKCCFDNHIGKCIPGDESEENCLTYIIKMSYIPTTYSNKMVFCHRTLSLSVIGCSTSILMLDSLDLRGCVENCQETGCVGSQQCFQHCIFTADGNISDGRWYLQEPLYLKWKQWDCHSDCRYYCMLAREEERRKLGEKPVKYHGRWPFRRVYGIQEPVSISFSSLNLAIQFHGWISFFILINYKLPLTDNRKTYYEYSGLWHIYGVLAMNCWFWAPVFHSRIFQEHCLIHRRRLMR
ncbi:uncharacterized protein [Spinacia oleracea]|uniref:Post-GPI attachment to proteins factor 3 n=1 Tax=Spinacia oleracea TaxID=3562 RepID=A0ABM3QPT3_SPIOL|nr:uncharacterized protein LOC130461332 [Spinacia oleracea]